MNFKELNEEIRQLLETSLNEISDETKRSYLAKRQAQLDKAKAAMDKARQSVRKSDRRQVAALPQGIDKETATDALQELKRRMKKIDSGSDWRLEEQDNRMILEVRYWGSWSGDDGSGDYDWQVLDDEYRDKLDDILTSVQKEYGVRIHEPGSEKNWLVFEIPITKLSKDSRLDYENEKLWQEFLQKNNGTDVTTTRHKNAGMFVAEFESYTLKTFEKRTFRAWITLVDNDLYTCKYAADKSKAPIKYLVKTPSSFKDCLEALQAECDRRNNKKNDPNRKRSDRELYQELWVQPLESENNSWLWSAVSKNLMEYYNASYNNTDSYFYFKAKYGVSGGNMCYGIKAAIHKKQVVYGKYNIVWHRDTTYADSKFELGRPQVEETYTFETEQEAYDIKTWFPMICTKLKQL